MKYFRLLRLQDQYLQIGAILAAVLLLGNSKGALPWIIATSFISIGAFVLNEIVDQDTDENSWNPAHKNKPEINTSYALFISLAFAGIGLVLSYIIGKFNWGIMMTIMAMGYSIPVLRFKNWPVIDIISQLAAWWFVPFLAIVGTSNIPNILFSIAGASFMWFVVFPYELADFNADKKAGILGTHVIIGIKNSLFLGFALGIIATLIYIFGGFFSIWWTWPMVVFQIIIFVVYLNWFKKARPAEQIKAMQKYVPLVKPFTQLMVVYLAVVVIFTLGN